MRVWIVPEPHGGGLEVPVTCNQGIAKRCVLEAMQWLSRCTYVSRQA
jgi:hypothetical protein